MHIVSFYARSSLYPYVYMFKQHLRPTPRIQLNLLTSPASNHQSKMFFSSQVTKSMQLTTCMQIIFMYHILKMETLRWFLSMKIHRMIQQQIPKYVFNLMKMKLEILSSILNRLTLDLKLLRNKLLPFMKIHQINRNCFTCNKNIPNRTSI